MIQMNDVCTDHQAPPRGELSLYLAARREAAR